MTYLNLFLRHWERELGNGMNTLEELVKGMRACQEKEGLNDDKFSKRLGIHPSLWTCIKFGKREPGAKVLKGIARAYPELHLAILQYLRDKV